MLTITIQLFADVYKYQNIQNNKYQNSAMLKYFILVYCIAVYVIVT